MRYPLLLALLCHLVLASGYWLYVPVLEAPGEELALTAAREHALGIARGDAYTALLAQTLRVAGTPDLHPIAAPTTGPGALRLRHAATPGLAHRSVGWLRLWSLLFGAVTIAATFALARAVFPAQPAIAATASLLMACMPQFANSHAVLWHGPLLSAATHVALLAAISSVARPQLHLGLATGGALACGLALHLDPCAWFAVLLSAGIAVARSGRLWRAGLALAGLAGACALGWWLSAWRGTPPVALDAGDRGVGALLWSFVGEAGRGALPVPWPALAMTGLAIAPALPGFVRGAREAAVTRLTFVALTLSCSLGTGACVALAMRQGLHGRGLLPALGPMLVLTAAGLVAHARQRPRVRAPAWAWLALAFAPSLAILLGSVRPALALAQVPAAERDAPFRELVLDLGSALQRAAAQAATTAHTRAPLLVWRSAPPHHDALAILDAAGRVLFTTDAGGPITAQRWQMPAAVFAALPRDVPLIWCVRRLDAAPDDRHAAAPFVAERMSSSGR